MKAMKAMQSDQAPASLARVQGTESYYFITMSPWAVGGGNAFSPGSSAHDWVPPCPSLQWALGAAGSTWQMSHIRCVTLPTVPTSYQ